ncbi:hypothetical protein FOL47_007259 [Perkinsus chesapeaki]|uniref:AB hydrolase-1 domain-containing protein n=1 Tax=Perkinsus chesapeaki TaxID=330153 RepID=A0A7J6LLQ1_PERCH|nr:hypothetical protein FOL47_007259 [Perkinsus chesapeaki]
MAEASSKALEWLFALKFAVNCLLFLLKSRIPRILTLLDLIVCLSSLGDFENKYRDHPVTLYEYVSVFVGRFILINIAFQYRRKTSLVPDIVVSATVVGSIIYSLWLYMTSEKMPAETVTIVVLCVLEGVFFLKHSDRVRQRKLWRFNANFRLTSRFPFAHRRHRHRHHRPNNADLEAPLLAPDRPEEISLFSSGDSEGDLEVGSKASSGVSDSSHRVFAHGPDAHYLCTATGMDYNEMDWPYRDTAGGILCYYQTARSTTPVVNLLLIHQFGGGCFTWKRAVPLLVDECNANVTCFDRPAHGFTERPKDPAAAVHIMGPDGRPVLLPPYSVAFARETVELFQRYTADSLPQILVGVGAGALLALESAARNTGSVTGVVLISPTVTTGMGLPGVIRSILTSNVSRALSLSMLRSEVADFMMKKSWYRSNKIPEWLKEDYRTPTRLEGWDAAIVEMNKQRTNVHWKIPQNLPSCPILLLTGDHDKVVPKREYQRFFTHLLSKRCDVRWEVVPRCGHLVCGQITSEETSCFCGPGEGGLQSLVERMVTLIVEEEQPAKLALIMRNFVEYCITPRKLWLANRVRTASANIVTMPAAPALRRGSLSALGDDDDDDYDELGQIRFLSPPLSSRPLYIFTALYVSTEPWDLSFWDTFRDAEQRGWEEYEEKRRMADWMARKDHKRRRMSETGCPKRQRKSSLITDVTMDTD